ncbi:hypothetical protein [Clostridium minihomine]|uniref:hypothetical protein n=1 Tax=Clostridium minihomine TaxID=2045012 RepID=UPI000C778A4A|nr:hypothetical protein [Clostridium minihomine]
MDDYRTQPNLAEQPELEESAEPPQNRGSVKLNLVADEDAAEYEEQHMGVRFSFVLQEDEAYEALRREDAHGPVRKKMLRRLGIMGSLTVIFLFLGLFLPQGEGYLKSSVLCATVALLVCIAPTMSRKGLAKRAITGQEVSIAVYPDEVEIGEGDGAWNIPMDGTAKLDLSAKVIALYTDDKILVIPQRCIEPAIRADVLAILTAGTRRRFS